MKRDYIIRIILPLLIMLVHSVAVYGFISRTSHPLLSSLFRTANRVRGPKSHPIVPYRNSYTLYDATRYFNNFAAKYKSGKTSDNVRGATRRHQNQIIDIRSSVPSPSTGLHSRAKAINLRGVKPPHRCRTCRNYGRTVRKHGNSNRHLSARRRQLPGLVFGGGAGPVYTMRGISHRTNTVEHQPHNVVQPYVKPIIPSEFHVQSEQSVESLKISDMDKAVSKETIKQAPQDGKVSPPYTDLNQIPSGVLNDMIKAPASNLKQEYNFIYNVLGKHSQNAEIPLKLNVVPITPLHIGSSRVAVGGQHTFVDETDVITPTIPVNTLDVKSGMVPEVSNGHSMEVSRNIEKSLDKNNQIFGNQFHPVNGGGSPSVHMPRNSVPFESEIAHNQVPGTDQIWDNVVPSSVKASDHTMHIDGFTDKPSFMDTALVTPDGHVNMKNNMRQPAVNVHPSNVQPSHPVQDMNQQAVHTNDVLHANTDLNEGALDLVHPQNNGGKLLRNPSVIPSLNVIGDILQSNIRSVNSVDIQRVLPSSAEARIPFEKPLNPNQNIPPHVTFGRADMAQEPFQSGFVPETVNDGPMSEMFPQNTHLGITVPNDPKFNDIIPNTDHTSNGLMTDSAIPEVMKNGDGFRQREPISSTLGNFESVIPVDGPSINGNTIHNPDIQHNANIVSDISTEIVHADIPLNTGDGFFNLIPDSNIHDIHVNAPDGFINLSPDRTTNIDQQQTVHMKEMSNINSHEQSSFVNHQENNKNSNQHIDIITEQNTVQNVDSTIRQDDQQIMNSIGPQELPLPSMEARAPIDETVHFNQNNPSQVRISEDLIMQEPSQQEFGSETVQDGSMEEIIPLGTHLGITVPNEPSINDNIQANVDQTSSHIKADSVFPKLMENGNGIRQREPIGSTHGITEVGVAVDVNNIDSQTGHNPDNQHHTNTVNDISTEFVHSDIPLNAGDGFINLIPEGNNNIEQQNVVHMKEMSNINDIKTSNSINTVAITKMPNQQTDVTTEVEIVQNVDTSMQKVIALSNDAISSELLDKIPILIDNMESPTVTDTKHVGHSEVNSAAIGSKTLSDRPNLHRDNSDIVVIKNVPQANIPDIFKPASLHNGGVDATEDKSQVASLDPNESVASDINNKVATDINIEHRLTETLTSGVMSDASNNADLNSGNHIVVHNEQHSGVDGMIKNTNNPANHVSNEITHVHAHIGHGDSPQINHNSPSANGINAAQQQTLHIMDLLSGGMSSHRADSIATGQQTDHITADAVHHHSDVHTTETEPATGATTEHELPSIKPLLKFEDLISSGFHSGDVTNNPNHDHSHKTMSIPANEVTDNHSVESKNIASFEHKNMQHTLATNEEHVQGTGTAAGFKTIAQASTPNIFADTSLQVNSEPTTIDNLMTLLSGSSSNMVSTDVLRMLVTAELSPSSSSSQVSSAMNNLDASNALNEVPIVSAGNSVVPLIAANDVHDKHVLNGDIGVTNDVVNSGKASTTRLAEQLPNSGVTKSGIPRVVPGLIASSIEIDNHMLGGEMPDSTLHSHHGIMSGNEIISDDMNVLDVTMDKAHQEAHKQEGDRSNHQHLHLSSSTPFEV